MFARKDESLTLPKNISGQPLSTEQDKESKKIRKKHYFWHSLGFALFVLVMDGISILLIERDIEQLIYFPNVNDTINVITVLGIEFIISFIIFFIIGHIMDEYAVRKYNKKINELENYDE